MRCVLSLKVNIFVSFVSSIVHSVKCVIIISHFCIFCIYIIVTKQCSECTQDLVFLLIVYCPSYNKDVVTFFGLVVLLMLGAWYNAFEFSYFVTKIQHRCGWTALPIFIFVSFYLNSIPFCVEKYRHYAWYYSVVSFS